MSPLSNNKLFLDYNKNPFPKVSISLISPFPYISCTFQCVLSTVFQTGFKRISEHRRSSHAALHQRRASGGVLSGHPSLEIELHRSV